MTYQAILYDVDQHVATITLNKPERLNAFDDEMLTEWADAIQVADADPDVRAVIITGAGRGFCSGMNVQNEAGGSGVLRTEAPVSERRVSLRNSVHPIPRALIQLEKPYIAAINGAAAGAGMDMASMADIRFASSTARVGMTYVRMGLIPGDGGCYTLPRLVGTQRALDMIWSGKLITAPEMKEIGYVLDVFEPDELMPKVTEYARQIARGPATAVQVSKKLVYRSGNMGFDEHLDLAQMAMFIAQTTEDAKEGPRAFVEKREPNFKGY
ncbi:MAG: enoyl-CoA hydratase/isomerase family protein [Dehalococcoidia bacterium]|nr:enoyl-CoA hydratase/isomerase family protein [Dehalococcoidia bacterium]MCA9825428.1 enoyl-CoA hydratase/isomerase family protein [Dehalococcoidia bacterium]MCA9843725.1 enoyl-CoA hydratase/isomerase family protein [Dehalococcoidia bacterium]